ncbi:MAG TPA: undecaprenyl-diphosphate phosphatase [Bacteroidales bacterium]|nr:undecaprenyl-diphosphate phosphatase [Bacteroidales bacterium]
MNWFEAIILGLIQGVTEFLPVSSSGHLELGKHLFGIDSESNFYFTIAVHGATVLSTITVFRKDILALLKGFFRFRMNEETIYLIKIAISMIPVGLAGVFLKDALENMFNGNMTALGIQFLITAILLFLTLLVKKGDKPISYLDSFIIGIAQAVAVVPAISRSGATIATGLILGNRKDEIARFSFLMVLVPVIGANLLEVTSKGKHQDFAGTGVITLGFISAFIAGYFACKWMVELVKRSKMIWFAIYCTVIGIISILLG